MKEINISSYYQNQAVAGAMAYFAHRMIDYPTITGIFLCAYEKKDKSYIDMVCVTNHITKDLMAQLQYLKRLYYRAFTQSGLTYSIKLVNSSTLHKSSKEFLSLLVDSYIIKDTTSELQMMQQAARKQKQDTMIQNNWGQNQGYSLRQMANQRRTMLLSMKQHGMFISDRNMLAFNQVMLKELENRIISPQKVKQITPLYGVSKALK